MAAVREEIFKRDRFPTCETSTTYSTITSRYGRYL